MSPLVPIGIVAMESLFPPLPLVVFVLWNVAAFGIFYGFLYSWIGTCLGSTIVFGAFRLFLKKFTERFSEKHPRIRNLRDKISNMSPFMLGLILMFPFTPTSLFNAAFGISNYSAKKYLITLYVAKTITIGSLSIFGKSVTKIFDDPLYIALSILIIVVLYVLSKLVWKWSKLDEK
ncbi:MAG: VTT domain-containing protein [Lachnospiraceae bacterium]|nr:VTT domain-containing protein [Lachnospiraceae bacterium]